MSKVAVVYWSGTGNTEEMARRIAQAAEADLYPIDTFSPDHLKEYSAVAFGCPSMGAEQLEDVEFEPVFEACKPALAGKPLALFGSYDWGDGDWMRTWQEECTNLGARLVAEGLICHLTPEAEDLENCDALGHALKNA